MATARRLPVVGDINLLVDALVADDAPDTWATPPPVRGDLSAMTIAILNEGLEFGLWLSPDILDGTRRVLTAVYDFTDPECDEYERFLREIARRTGGVLTPTSRVADCRDWEDNRILDLATDAGAFLLLSSDADLQEMSPWRGIPIIGPDAFVARVDAARRKRR
ncbi:MAG: PIN domain-containing protein [Candidatus Dormibacteraeota bacterium]|nr:PIN domain-containing protein [Candidatus Dormibacteraeota bacterium]